MWTMLAVDRQLVLGYFATLFNSNMDEFIYLCLFYIILVFTTAVHCDEIKDYFIENWGMWLKLYY